MAAGGGDDGVDPRSAGQAGIVQPYGKSADVPIFERFYAGGFGSVRGFDFRGVGPHVGTISIGGETRVVGNVEYTFPLTMELLRGVVFYDVGTVYRFAEDTDLAGLRHAVGFGLRLTVPQLGPIPLAFDWAWALNPQRGDEEEVFSFSIGAVF